MNVKLNMTLGLRSLVVMAILSASTAFGQLTETFTATFVNEPSTYFPANISLPGFNNDGGALTLQSVTIGMENFTSTAASGSGQPYIYNASGFPTMFGGPAPGNPSDFNENLEITFANIYNVADSFGDMETLSFSSSNTFNNVAWQTGSNEELVTGPTGSQGTPNPLTTVATSSLSNFETTNNLTLTLGGSTTITGSAQPTGTNGQGYASEGGAVLLSGEIYIEYTYIPEPQETAAWMLGFVLFLLMGRIYWRSGHVLPPPGGADVSPPFAGTEGSPPGLEREGPARSPPDPD